MRELRKVSMPLVNAIDTCMFVPALITSKDIEYLKKYFSLLEEIAKCNDEIIAGMERAALPPAPAAEGETK